MKTSTCRRGSAAWSSSITMRPLGLGMNIAFLKEHLGFLHENKHFPTGMYLLCAWGHRTIFDCMDINYDCAGKKLVDLYSDYGLCALAMARQGWQVTAVESHPGKAECIQESAKASGLSHLVEVVCMDSAKFADQYGVFDSDSFIGAAKGLSQIDNRQLGRKKPKKLDIPPATTTDLSHLFPYEVALSHQCHPITAECSIVEEVAFTAATALAGQVVMASSGAGAIRKLLSDELFDPATPPQYRHQPIVLNEVIQLRRNLKWTDSNAVDYTFSYSVAFPHDKLLMKAEKQRNTYWEKNKVSLNKAGFNLVRTLGLTGMGKNTWESWI